MLHPDRAVVKFHSGGTLDFGALCYLRRSKKRRRNANNGKVSGRDVDVASLSPARFAKIRELVTFLSEEVTLGGKRKQSLYSLAGEFMRFMDWADSHSHLDVLTDIGAAYPAFRQYVEHLRERVAHNNISVNTAATLQQCTLTILSSLWGVDDLHKGVNLLRTNQNVRESTEPPCEDSQAKVLSLCTSLFDGLSELALEEKSYPYCLQMPKYLGWGEPALWIFPTMRRFMPPAIINKREEISSAYWAYEYATGQLANYESIAARLGGEGSETARRVTARRLVAAAEKIIAAANNDHRHPRRLADALIAHNAFVLLFVANTGLNWAQVEGLPWADSYAVGNERQGFRAIKWRAGGKTVSVELQLTFLPAFKRFLSLRTYLLNGAQFDRLFVSLGPNAKHAPKQIGRTLLDGLFKTLRAIDPTLPKIKSRKWRAGKSDWFLRETDPATSSDALQNTEETVLRSYASGSPTKAAEEFSDFFEHMTKAVLAKIILPKGAVVPNAQEGPVGLCAVFGMPHHIDESVPVEPDCKRQEGCFFCDKFRIHADEKDTRKLLSCRYCIRETMHHPGAEAFFSPVLIQIQSLLDEIATRESGPKMVEEIRREVDEEGELDGYWAGKLELLINLELA